MTQSNGDNRQARIEHAQELMGALGPRWQPAPCDVDWIGTASATGEKVIVMVVSDLYGRTGYAFTPEALEKTCTDGLAVAEKGKAVSTPIQVAKTMPQGVPLPGKDPFRG